MCLWGISRRPKDALRTVEATYACVALGAAMGDLAKPVASCIHAAAGSTWPDVLGQAAVSPWETAIVSPSS